MYNSGVFYTKGWGTKIDYCKAVYWYNLATQENYLPVIHNLATRYVNGECVEESDSKAIVLWKRAARSGYKLSIDMLSSYNIRF